MRAFAASRGITTNGNTANPFFKKGDDKDSFFSNENKSPSFFSESPIQPKLNIGQPNDKFEKEADVMADNIVENNDPSPMASPVQMKCNQCDQEEKIDKKEEEQETETVMKKSAFEGEQADTPEDEDSSDETNETLQTKKESPAQNPKKPATISLPSSRVGTPIISHQILSGGGQQITQKIPFTQYIQKAPSTDSEKENGQEKEAPIRKGRIKTTEDDMHSNMDNSVSTSLNYVPTVNRGGPAPSGTEFGVTNSSASVTNVVVSPSFGTLFNSGVYTVTGDLELEIEWEARSGTGPGGQVDIQNQNDPDLKACNYQLAASDLTPDMGSDNGRPPRTKFWAEDLTIRHELFHAVDQRQLDYGPKRLTAIQDDLNKQKPTSAGEIISTLLPAAEREGQRVFNALNARPSREGDAYGDGAPLYLARANAIKAKGDTGGYGQVAVTVKILPKGGGTHTVVKGDTLWGIAESTYGHGKFWRDIHDANPGKARNGGNLIFPGQIFDLPHINFDKEVSLGLLFGANLVLTSDQLIPGGGSHTFNTLPNSLFDDTTNCAGDITVEVLDVDGNTLLSTLWGIPANKNSKSGDIEVDMEITSGAAAGP
ncbi:MAG: LysM peptidoglycan-binding domain-containing protein [Bacteroidota bacterium]